MEVTIMKSRFIWRAFFALVFTGLLALGGIALYQMGFSHGAMANITLPEGSELPMMPFAYRSLNWHYGPRIGLLGLLPLLCFGGFFFLMMICAFGFMARRRAWKHYGPRWDSEHWKHHGPPPWGPGRPPWWQSPGAEDQPEAEPETPPTEAEPSER
jgi:hypothetical protein